MMAMLRQLRSGLGDFHVDGNFVYLARDQPDTARLEAIDVMLELGEGAPQGFTVKVDSPRLLRFTLGGDKLKLFSVAKLSHVSEPQQLQRERSERIVWISDSSTPPEGLVLPNAAQLAQHLQDVFLLNRHEHLYHLPGGALMRLSSGSTIRSLSLSAMQLKMVAMV
jgi:hypothetical protein